MVSGSSDNKPIEQYQHKGKERCNNPPVGLVTPETDVEKERKKYEYDPHLDPQLWWAGKMGHMAFEVPTVSLHVHERIDPLTIVKALKKKNGEAKQMSLFEYAEENPALGEAIEFYKHRHNWSNRLIAGDSLLVMNSLLEKEGMAGKVQMVYLDPPYGIKYGSNFQPFVNKRDVKDGKDEDLTQEPEMVKAFRDTWELGIHSYLTYLRDRLLLAKELLTESGSCFVQISDENLHHVKELMDEIFGSKNYCGIISFRKTAGQTSELLASVYDFLVWYAKDINKVKFNALFRPRTNTEEINAYPYLEDLDRNYHRYKSNEPIKEGYKLFQPSNLTSQTGSETSRFTYNYEGKAYRPPGVGRGWTLNLDNMKRVEKSGRLLGMGNTLVFRRYLDDFPFVRLTSTWEDTVQSTFASQKIYVVQTSVKVVERCLLMTTEPGDIVFDPTCGSGTTAFVAEKYGRRWITCDTSRVAITIAKQRLLTGLFDYFELSYPQDGVDSGFRYKAVQHISLKSIGNCEQIDAIYEKYHGLADKKKEMRLKIEDVIMNCSPKEYLYDQPIVDVSKIRVTGPFTVEAVPAPTILPISEFELPKATDDSIARTGETVRQAEWRSELLKTGIRGHGGQSIGFTRVEPLAGTHWLHADAESRDTIPQRAVVSFGPEHAPMDKKQVESAILEAQDLVPKPKIIVFAAFQFDPEAARLVEDTKWRGVTLIKAQMNADLLTKDLKKKQASNQSFWMVGQPDVTLVRIKEGDNKGKYVVEVHGFDYYDTRTQQVESGSIDKVAMWMLDTDYDRRSLFPRQVFFPTAGDKDGWSRLAKNLKAEIDEERIEQFKGNKSLPFAKGSYGRIAVKIVDDRGIECLRQIDLE